MPTARGNVDGVTDRNLIFTRVDTNGDGKISLEEYTQYFMEVLSIENREDLKGFTDYFYTYHARLTPLMTVLIRMMTG